MHKWNKSKSGTGKLRKVGKAVIAFALIVIIVFLCLLGYLLANSKGTTKPFFDETGNIKENSVSEKVWVYINGDKQGMFLLGKNMNNPALLFVHGGPGMPEYFMFEQCKTELQEHFTICLWEQRGSGISYLQNTDTKSFTAEQFIDDTIEVSKYLGERFGQEKIYLMGHSWGSFIAIQAAAKAPELYHAYIGIAQISNQAKSESIAFQYMKNEYILAGNTKMMKKLETYGDLNTADGLYDYFLSPLRDDAMHRLGVGTTHNMHSVVDGVFWPIMRCNGYTMQEKINIWKGKAQLKHCGLISEMLTTDLTEKVTSLEIPVYFVSGIYDYTVCHSLSQTYLAQIEAPTKGFYTFTQSAHSPIFEEPEKFTMILCNDVLNGSYLLAD